MSRRKRDRPDGIGFVLAAGDGLVGVDLDRCRNPMTGEVEPWAVDIITRLDTYAEVSPSGTGIKLVLRGALPFGGRRAGNVEMYDSRRFFALTGRRLPNSPRDVQCRADAILDYHRRTFPAANNQVVEGELTSDGFPGAQLSDDEVMALLRKGRQGEKFALLLAGKCPVYRSESEADIALCGMFARAVGPNSGRIERLFEQSILSTREKWIKRPDYRKRTVNRAVQGLASWSGKESQLAITLTMTTQDKTGITQGFGQENSQAEATASAISLAIEQENVVINPYRRSFTLARRLMKFGVNPEHFESAVRAYCERANQSFEEMWLRVLDCWPLVEIPEGGGAWAWAVQQARERPIDTFPAKGEKFNLAASLAHYLSELSETFPFPVEKVGEFLGMSPQMGSIVIRLLEREGVIALARNYNRGRNLAKEFTYIWKGHADGENATLQLT